MIVDTIFAPASGLGKAALSVIRLSGPGTRTVLETLAGPVPPPRRLSLRYLKDPSSAEILDEALVVWFPAPHSFTGEDQAELHSHGGLAVREAVMAALGRFPGLRLAEPGEFARRAFLNQRLDLPRIEGLADLIDAETEQQRRQALRQMGGALSRQCDLWRDALLQGSALIESMLDFSDEGDVTDSLAPVFAGIAALRNDIAAKLTSARQGERLREGFVVALLGPPNAGKSSLLNALAGREAAIVSPVAGTTRDVIELSCVFDGFPVILIDTAGLRDSIDSIEQEGMARARQRAESADLVLWLQASDAPREPPPPVSCPVITVHSKADRVAFAPEEENPLSLWLSVHDKNSLNRLVKCLLAHAGEALGAGDALVTRERHRLALEQVVAALDRITHETLVHSPELAAEDLRHALQALGRITGRVGVEAMLDQLFARFCIGK
jgi:tRNA modification GTPase